MKPSTALALRQPEAAKAPRRRKAQPFSVRLLVLNPYANGKLRAMAALGATLTATIDGDWLTIRAEVER